MIKLTVENTAKAIERAKAEAKNLFVQKTEVSRQYQVTNRAKNATYLVKFAVQNCNKLGQCDCQGGQRNLVCKHLVAAASLNMYLAQNGMLAVQQ